MSSKAPSLNQDIVQARMAYACNLLQDRFILAGRNVSDASEFYDQVEGNGLCGAWTVIHRDDPDWLAGVWQSLVDWDHSGSRTASDLADLDDLEGQLRRHRLGAPNHELEEVPRLLTTAWNIMRKLEPEAGYGPVNDWLSRLGGAVEYADRKPVKTFNVTAKVTDAGNAICGLLVSQAGFPQQPGKGKKNNFAHIETDYHHMGVHLELTAKRSTIRVCEPEKAGVVECTTDELPKILAGGAATGYGVEELKTVKTFSVRIYSRR